MLITIITPTFNSENTLENCLKSVRDQKYHNYEHLIIDNNSTDNTKNIIKKFASNKIKTVSETDEGIYYAMNKGVKYSKGEFILFLNSDDQLIDEFFLLNYIKILEENIVDILYSNVLYKKNIFGFSRKFKTGNTLNINKVGFHLPHPGTLIRKKYLINSGLFDLRYKISADFDFFIKSKNNKNTKYRYYNNYTVLMSIGGASSGLKNIIKANIECYKSLKRNNEKNPFLFIFLKLFRKFFQLI